MAKPAESFLSVLKLLVVAAAVVAAILAAIGLVAPVAAVSAVPGVTLGAVAALTFGRIGPSVLTVLVLCVITWVAFLVNGNVWVSASLMGLVGLALGLSCRIGLHSLVMTIAIFSSSALFPATPPAGEIGNVAGATSTAAAILAGGVISAICFHLLTRGKTLPKSPIIAWQDTSVHTIALVVTLFIGTLAVLSWDRTPVGAWLLVTIVVLSQPIDIITRRRSIERVLGTAAGALLAGLVAIVVTTEWVTITIALLCLVLAWSFRLSHPEVEQGHRYWIYALIWTPAMVLLAVPQGGSVTLDADGQRVLLTVIAAIAVVLVSYAARFSIIRLADRNRNAGSDSPAVR
ncbi:MAG: FUSC family protein [Actinobacteria bacterium]|nr:FUSC family protein [Actinomycetota bacterium]